MNSVITTELERRTISDRRQHCRSLPFYEDWWHRGEASHKRNCSITKVYHPDRSFYEPEQRWSASHASQKGSKQIKQFVKYDKEKGLTTSFGERHRCREDFYFPNKMCRRVEPCHDKYNEGLIEYNMWRSSRRLSSRSKSDEYVTTTMELSKQPAKLNTANYYEGNRQRSAHIDDETVSVNYLRHDVDSLSIRKSVGDSSLFQRDSPNVKYAKEASSSCCSSEGRLCVSDRLNPWCLKHTTKCSRTQVQKTQPASHNNLSAGLTSRRSMNSTRTDRYFSRSKSDCHSSSSSRQHSAASPENTQGKFKLNATSRDVSRTEFSGQGYRNEIHRMTNYRCKMHSQSFTESNLNRADPRSASARDSSSLVTRRGRFEKFNQDIHLSLCDSPSPSSGSSLPKRSSDKRQRNKKVFSLQHTYSEGAKSRYKAHHSTIIEKKKNQHLGSMFAQIRCNVHKVPLKSTQKFFDQSPCVEAAINSVTHVMRPDCGGTNKIVEKGIEVSCELEKTRDVHNRPTNKNSHETDGRLAVPNHNVPWNTSNDDQEEGEYVEKSAMDKVQVNTSVKRSDPVGELSRSEKVSPGGTTTTPYHDAIWAPPSNLEKSGNLCCGIVSSGDSISTTDSLSPASFRSGNWIDSPSKKALALSEEIDHEISPRSQKASLFYTESPVQLDKELQIKIGSFAKDTEMQFSKFGGPQSAVDTFSPVAHGCSTIAGQQYASDIPPRTSEANVLMIACDAENDLTEDSTFELDPALVSYNVPPTEGLPPEVLPFSSVAVETPASEQRDGTVVSKMLLPPLPNVAYSGQESVSLSSRVGRQKAKRNTVISDSSDEDGCASASSNSFIPEVIPEVNIFSHSTSPRSPHVQSPCTNCFTSLPPDIEPLSYANAEVKAAPLTQASSNLRTAPPLKRGGGVQPSSQEMPCFLKVKKVLEEANTVTDDTYSNVEVFSQLDTAMSGRIRRRTLRIVSSDSESEIPNKPRSRDHRTQISSAVQSPVRSSPPLPLTSCGKNLNSARTSSAITTKETIFNTKFNDEVPTPKQQTPAINVAVAEQVYTASPSHHSSPAISLSSHPIVIAQEPITLMEDVVIPKKKNLAGVHDSPLKHSFIETKINENSKLDIGKSSVLAKTTSSLVDGKLPNNKRSRCLDIRARTVRRKELINREKGFDKKRHDIMQPMSTDEISLVTDTRKHIRRTSRQLTEKFEIDYTKYLKDVGNKGGKYDTMLTAAKKCKENGRRRTSELDEYLVMPPEVDQKLKEHSTKRLKVSHLRHVIGSRSLSNEEGNALEATDREGSVKKIVNTENGPKKINSEGCILDGADKDDLIAYQERDLIKYNDILVGAAESSLDHLRFLPSKDTSHIQSRTHEGARDDSDLTLELTLQAENYPLDVSEQGLPDVPVDSITLLSNASPKLSAETKVEIAEFPKAECQAASLHLLHNYSVHSIDEVRKPDPPSSSTIDNFEVSTPCSQECVPKDLPVLSKDKGKKKSGAPKFSRELCNLYQHLIDSGASQTLFEDRQLKRHGMVEGETAPSDSIIAKSTLRLSEKQTSSLDEANQQTSTSSNKVQFKRGRRRSKNLIIEQLAEAAKNVVAAEKPSYTTKPNPANEVKTLSNSDVGSSLANVISIIDDSSILLIGESSLQDKSRHMVTPNDMAEADAKMQRITSKAGVLSRQTSPDHTVSKLQNNAAEFELDLHIPLKDASSHGEMVRHELVGHSSPNETQSCIAIGMQDRLMPVDASSDFCDYHCKMIWDTITISDDFKYRRFSSLFSQTAVEKYTRLWVE